MGDYAYPAQGAVSLPDLSDLRNWQVGFRDAFPQGVLADGDPRDDAPAPLSASWHHLPCVTAGAVPPARAEEPIRRALRQGGR